MADYYITDFGKNFDIHWNGQVSIGCRYVVWRKGKRKRIVDQGNDLALLMKKYHLTYDDYINIGPFLSK